MIPGFRLDLIEIAVLESRDARGADRAEIDRLGAPFRRMTEPHLR